MTVGQAGSPGAERPGPASSADPAPGAAGPDAGCPVERLDYLNGTAEAAFATDGQGRILGWNRAARDLFGHEADSVVGQRCFQVLEGKDLFGNRFCGPTCPVRQMIRRREPVHTFHAVFRTRRGAAVTARCEIVVGSLADGRCVVVHLLEPDEALAALPPPDRAAAGIVERGEAAARPLEHGHPEPAPEEGAALTHREIEVLRLLNSGAGISDIAAALGISAVTVRNHVQHVLQKLQVHNRLQAVAAARRDHIL